MFPKYEIASAAHRSKLAAAKFAVEVAAAVLLTAGIIPLIATQLRQTFGPGKQARKGVVLVESGVESPPAELHAATEVAPQPRLRRTAAPQPRVDVRPERLGRYVTIADGREEFRRGKADDRAREVP